MDNIADVINYHKTFPFFLVSSILFRDKTLQHISLRTDHPQKIGNNFPYTFEIRINVPWHHSSSNAYFGFSI